MAMVDKSKLALVVRGGDVADLWAGSIVVDKGVCCDACHQYGKGMVAEVVLLADDGRVVSTQSRVCQACLRKGHELRLGQWAKGHGYAV